MDISTLINQDMQSTMIIFFNIFNNFIIYSIILITILLSCLFLAIGLVAFKWIYNKRHKAAEGKLVISHLMRKHWIVFSDSALFVIVAILLVGFGSNALSLLFFAVAFVQGMKAYETYKASDFSISEHHLVRLLQNHKKTDFDIDVTDIEAIKIEQNSMGKVLDFGTIIIKESNGDRDIFVNVNHPYKAKECIEDDIHYAKAA